jgi:diguanylate cyclase (GGDEF)-like protein
MMEVDERVGVAALGFSGEEIREYVLDPAKGLGLICDAIEKTMVKNEDRPKSAALLAVSIDNMRSITDLFGPEIVDPVFVDLNRRMRDCLRASDVIARLGDDQLGIVLPYFRFNGAAIALKRILALRSKPVSTHYGSIDLKLSVATVLFPDENLVPANVITRAQATIAYNQNRKEDTLELTRSVRERINSLRFGANQHFQNASS